MLPRPPSTKSHLSGTEVQASPNADGSKLIPVQSAPPSALFPNYVKYVSRHLGKGEGKEKLLEEPTAARPLMLKDTEPLSI